MPHALADAPEAPSLLGEAMVDALRAAAAGLIAAQSGALAVEAETARWTAGRLLIALSARAVADAPGRFNVHRGRGPHGFDGFGLLRQAAGAADGRPLPDEDYGPAGPTREALEAWLRAAGFAPVAAAALEPGDVCLFDLGCAHPGVVIRTAPEPQLASAAPGRAPGRQWLGPWWRDRLQGVWRWSAPAQRDVSSVKGMVRPLGLEPRTP